MTRARIALALGATLLAGVFAVPSAAAGHTVTNACVLSVPETDPLEPGPTKICYTLFKPATASPDSPAPVVLHSHGWGGSRTKTVTSQFQQYLDAGIGVLSFDQRGFGESGGKAHVEDPDFEGRDTIKMIDVVAAQDWVLENTVTTTETIPGDPGKGKKGKGSTPDTTVTTTTVDEGNPMIGAIGGSYGGGYQFVGAFTEMMLTGKTRFDALAPEITWWDLSESLAPQNVVRTAWSSLLYAAGTDAHTSTVHAGLAQGLATGQWPAEMAAFFENNGPAWHVKNGRRLDIPVVAGENPFDARDWPCLCGS